MAWRWVRVAWVLVGAALAGCQALPAFFSVNQPAVAVTATEEGALFDFSDPQTAAGWFTVNDDVMGGVSVSYLRATDDDSAIFGGEISFENNGGFATVQANFAAPLDLSAHDGLALRVRGDGKRYGVYLRDNANNIRHQAVFDTEAGVWQDVRLPFTAFQPTYFGQVVRTGALNTRSIRSISLLIEFYQEGAFALEVARIGVY